MHNKIRASQVTFKDWPALLLENDLASMVVIPQIGGKVASIKSRVTGREFLWQDNSRPYRQPQYGDGFGNYDISGFDECFPSISECAYPEFPWKGVAVPDHGELWCIPWQFELQESAVYLHTYGIRFPYHFEKWITLSPVAGQYTFSYRITNLSPFPFEYLWSAHPLFAAQEGMRILLPGEPEVRLTFTLGDRVSGGFLQTYRWPRLSSPSGESVDYSLIGSPSLKANDKVYANSPADGWCGLHYAETGDFVAISFSPQKTPFVGICIDHAGWPFEGIPGFWVALEPCVGYPDSLEDAVSKHEHATLSAYGNADWSLTFHVGQADSTEAISGLLARQV